MSDLADRLDWLATYLRDEDLVYNDKAFGLRDEIKKAAARLRKLEADKRRMDYLESEAIREIDLTGPRSLFRRNMPITREAIDEALAACGDES